MRVMDVPLLLAMIHPLSFDLQDPSRVGHYHLNPHHNLPLVERAHPGAP